MNGEENPFPAIGDMAYRKLAGGGSSHGHSQQAQKFGKDRAVGYVRVGQTDRQTETQSSQYFATAHAGEVIMLSIVHFSATAELFVYFSCTLSSHLPHQVQLQ